MMKKGYLWVVIFLLIINCVHAQYFTTEFLQKMFGIEESELLIYFIAWAAFFIMFSRGTTLVFRENRVAAMVSAFIMALLSLRFVPRQVIEMLYLPFLGIVILIGPIAVARWAFRSKKWRIVLILIIYGMEVYLIDTLFRKGLSKVLLEVWYGAPLSVQLSYGAVLALISLYVVWKVFLEDVSRPKITGPELEHRLDVRRDKLAEKRARRRRK